MPRSEPWRVAGLLHLLNGPDDGITSSWAQVFAVGAFYGLSTAAFTSIERVQDRIKARRRAKEDDGGDELG